MTTPAARPRRVLVVLVAAIFLALTAATLSAPAPASAATAIEKAQARVKQARETLAKVRVQMTAAQSALSTADAAYSTAFAAEAAAETAYIAATDAAYEAQTALTDAEIDLGAAQEAKKAAYASSAVAYGNLHKAAAALASARKHHAPPARVAALVKQVAAAKAKTKAASARVAAAKTKVTTLTAKVTGLRADSAAADADVLAKQEVKDQAAAVLTSATAALQAADDRYTAAQATTTAAEDELDTALAKLEALKSKTVTETFRVATANVRFSLTDRQAATALDAVLDKGVDLLGAQEWKPENRTNATPRIRKAGWAVFTPARGDSIVVWRPARYSAIKSFTTPVGDAVYAGPVPGENVSNYTRAMFAATVRLRDKETGLVISMTSVHLPAHVSVDGRPRPGASQARIDQRQRAEKALNELVIAEKKAADLVFVAGDFNVDYRSDRQVRHAAFTEYWMSKIGMVNAYENPGGLPTNASIGGQLYDGVYSNIRSDNARILNDANGSDHHPVLTVYKHTTHLK